jgi:hypothetical protein
MTTIVDFPARFAFINTSDGTLTPEARRMLRGWFARIGGRDGVSAEDLAVMLAFVGPVDVWQDEIQAAPDHGAAIAELQKQIEELRQALAFVNPLQVKEDVYASIF